MDYGEQEDAQWITMITAGEFELNSQHPYKKQGMVALVCNTCLRGQRQMDRKSSLVIQPNQHVQRQPVLK